MVLANQLSQAAAIIQQGGVIAYSTDTILGLGCDPQNRTAVERVLWLKQRGVEKGLILLMEDPAVVEQYSQPLSNQQYAEISSPVSQLPVTWLLPAQHAAPDWITGGQDRVALRITSHPIARGLCARLGAIVSTSANFSNYPVATDARQIRTWFGPHLDYVIIGASGTGAPSEIRDLRSGRILRKNV